jgi:hypothetical protein
MISENNSRSSQKAFFGLDLPGGSLLLVAAVIFSTALEYTPVGNSQETARVIGFAIGSGAAIVIFTI